MALALADKTHRVFVCWFAAHWVSGARLITIIIIAAAAYQELLFYIGSIYEIYTDRKYIKNELHSAVFNKI